MEVLDEVKLARLAADNGLPDASIVLESLEDGGVRLAVEPDRPIYPASMIKVPIAMALTLRCEAGTLGWSDRTAIDPSNLTKNDAPSPFVPGYEATLAELMRAMIAASDNVATNVLIDVLGRDTVGPACAAFGLRATAVRRKLSGRLPLIDDPHATGRNSHPAGDAGRLFAAIAARHEAGPDPLHEALDAQVWNDKLSRGLQPNDHFSHKTGDTDDTSHDGGILTLPDGRRFVLVVYTALPATPATEVRFGAFASALRPYLDL